MTGGIQNFTREGESRRRKGKGRKRQLNHYEENVSKGLGDLP